jgi:flagellar motility protein MotE (MotC chaperone)
MVRLLQSHAFAGFVGMALYLAVTAWCWPSIQLGAPRESGASSTSNRGPAWDFSNPEVDLLVAELNKEKTALAQRAQQLDELAARLQAEQLELNAVTQSVHRLQKELDETLVRVSEEEISNLKKLAKVYAAMSPDAAASILKQIDESSIVKILLFMKEDETAPVLETLAKLGEAESKMAASISERLRVAVFRKPVEKRS